MGTSLFGKHSDILYEVKYVYPYNPTVSLLGIHSEKNHVQEHIWVA